MLIVTYCLPGALAQTVISTIEAVGSACMRFAADHHDQVRGNTPPGALAKAVISTIEAIGTWPTIANKGASNQLDCCSAPFEKA